MGEETRILEDPAFQRLLTIRSRWRWALSGIVIGSYLLYAVGGVYFPEAYARPFPGFAMPWGMMMGMLIIVLSIPLRSRARA
jgi:uncharacterized membrane protein (DUF485 family)